MDARGQAPLTGRSRETAELGGCLTRLEVGRGSLLLVAADAGTGRSRLAFEATVMATARGVASGWGRSRLDGATATLVPWARALGDAGVGDLFALIDRATAEGAREGGDADRRGLFDEVAERLRLAAPVVVVLDDLDEADDASLALLAHVAGRLPDLPVLVVATFRPASATRRLALGRLLRDVVDELGCDVLELDALAVDDAIECAQALAGRRLDPERLIAVVARSGGNPFLIDELLRATTEGVETSLPRTARELLTARIDALGPTVRRAVEALAVLGGEADLGTVRRVAGGPVGAVGADRGADLGADLGAAVAAGLVERSGGAALQVRHPLVWDAVMTGLTEEGAGHLHARALDAVAAATGLDPGVRAEAMAHHALAAGLDRDGPALVLEAARWCRRRGGSDNAAGLLARALATWTDRTDPTERAELSTARGEALLAVGEVREAREAFEAALGSAPGHAGLTARARAGILACVAAGDH
jgi:hypothetical protein